MHWAASAYSLVFLMVTKLQHDGSHYLERGKGWISNGEELHRSRILYKALTPIQDPFIKHTWMLSFASSLFLKEKEVPKI